MPHIARIERLSDTVGDNRSLEHAKPVPPFHRRSDSTIQTILRLHLDDSNSSNYF